jgi:Replication-relaxation
VITNPPQQRNLGRRALSRPAARTVASSDHQLWLAAHLTPRDKWITRMLHEHRVLTTHQIVQLAWTGRRAANLRLLELYRWRMIDRFQPLIAKGLAPMHYVLDIAGATVLADEDGLDPAKIGYQRDRAKGIAHSLRLAHTVAVNGFFTNLIHHARQRDAAGILTAWWSENRCAQLYGDIVRPDAYGRWRQHGTEVDWFLELDFGTEPLRRITSKLTGYHQLAITTRITTPVLFWFPTATRETGARRALAQALRDLDDPALVPIATTAADLTPPDQHLDPSPARWLPLTSTRPGRIPLHQLGYAWPNLTPPGNDRRHDIASPSGRPGRLHPPNPMPPTDLAGQQPAAA